MAMFKLTSGKIYANVTAGWTDISADVIGSIQAEWGITGTTPNDRTASTGTMQFSLRNNSGNYTPAGASVTAGWERGVEIKLECVYDGDTYRRFYGVVESIDLAYEIKGMSRANVTVVDWMDYSAEHPITTPALQTNKTADEAIETILSGMPIRPVAQSLDDGVSTFPSVFDVVRKKSRAMSEMSSLVNSELGYLYLRKEKNTGEQLTFENAQHRSGLMSQATIPVLSASAGFLLMETGDKLLLETGDKIILSEVAAASFSDGQTAIEVDHGANTANRIVVTAYPRKVDASAVVLYTLGSPMQIGNGETVTFTANYTYNGLRCGGTAMVTPVITTDYLLNTLSDGTGTNLSTSAIVTVTFGGNSAQVSVKNTNVLGGYITFFRLRGKGVYTYDEAVLTLEDAAAVIEYGEVERAFDQKYQGSLSNSAGIAQTSLFYDRYPRTVLQSITYCANKTSNALMGFLNLDVGDLISVTTTAAEIAGAYIIQNVSFRIDPAGIIWVTYGVVEHFSLLTSTMTSLALEFTADTKDAVNFGYLPQVVQTSARSYTAWVYKTPDVNGYIISGPFADGGGIIVYSPYVDSIWVYSNLFNTTPGRWKSADDTLPTGEWVHVAVTLDCWDVDAVPIIYINAVSKAITEVNDPSGTLNSEYGAEVVVGNWHTDTQDYNVPWVGQLKDVRIYNRILTAAEVTTLYNSGTPDTSLVTSGCVFQACVVPKFMEDDYDGVALTEQSKVLDNIYGAVGTPIFGVEVLPI